jgi:lipoprotein signal peptidase
VQLPFGWHYPWGGTEIWPYVSNVADLFLILGIGVLVIRALRNPHSKLNESVGAPAPTSTTTDP